MSFKLHEPDKVRCLKCEEIFTLSEHENPVLCGGCVELRQKQLTGVLELLDKLDPEDASV